MLNALKQARQLLFKNGGIFFVSLLLLLGTFWSTPAFAEASHGSEAVLISGGTRTVDLPNGSAKELRIAIHQGRFASQSVGDLSLEVDGINYQQGRLERLSANIDDAILDTVPVQHFHIETGPFAFDTFELLNHRRFVLSDPARGKVVLQMTEENLNRFLSHPKIIGRLEKAVAKKTGNIKLITFANPEIDLLGRGRFQMSLMVLAGNAVAAPVEMTGKMGLKKGNLNVNGIRLSSDGAALPVELAPIFEKELNKLLDLKRVAGKYFVIRAKQLNMTRKDLTLRGGATLKQLDIGL